MLKIVEWFFYLLPLVFTVVLAVRILIEKNKKREHYLYSLASLTLVLWPLLVLIHNNFGELIGHNGVYFFAVFFGASSILLQLILCIHYPGKKIKVPFFITIIMTGVYIGIAYITLSGKFHVPVDGLISNENKAISCIGHLHLLYCLIFSLLTICILFYKLKTESVEVKPQLRYILTGYITGIVLVVFFNLFVVFFNWPTWLYPIGYISPLFITGGYYLSILKTKAYDIKTVIHQPFLWGCISLISIFSIISGYRYFMMYSSDSFQEPSIQQTPYLEFLTIVALYVLLKAYFKVVQPRIDHLFYKKRQLFKETLRAFSWKLERIKTVDDVYRELNNIATNLFYAKAARLVLHTGSHILEYNGQEPVTQLVRDKLLTEVAGGGSLFFPIHLDEKVLGGIYFEEKKNLKPYTKLEKYYIHKLTVMLSVYLDNLLIFKKLKEEEAHIRNVQKMKRKEVRENTRSLEAAYYLKQLSYLVTHEIKNTLYITDVCIDMIIEKSNVKSVAGIIGDINARMQQLNRFSKKYLLQEKVSIQSQEEQFKQVFLKDLIAQTVEHLTPLKNEKNITLITDLCTNDRVKVDVDKIMILLENLLHNALCYSPNQSMIEINTEIKNEQLCLMIKDEGPGLQADWDTQTNQYNLSTGFGLSICKTIMKQHHIHYTVDSLNGTCFVVYFKPD